MKKSILKHVYGALLLPMLFAAIGCSNDSDEPTQPTIPSQGKEMFLQVSMEDNKKPSSRVSYHDDKVGGVNTLLWEEGDKIKVVGMDGNTYKGEKEFALVDGKNTKNGKFKGEVIPGAKSYKIYYPSTVEVNKDNGSATLDMNKQQQTGDNDSKHLRNYIFLEGGCNAGGTENVNLKMNSSIMKFEFAEVPKEVGKLKKLLFVVGKRENADDENSLVNYEHVQELDFAENSVTFSEHKNTLTAYLSFMPNSFKVEDGSVVQMILFGDQNYQEVVVTASTKTYDPGKRYKITSVPKFKFRSPLEYAAERNLAPIEGEVKPEKAKFAPTDANDVSGFFTRAETEKIFDINNNTYISIDNVEYVYPDAKQWCSIIPAPLPGGNNFLIAFNPQTPRKDYEEDVKVGKMHVKAKNDYLCPKSGVVYALRFKDNINLWRTAWRYSIVENKEPYTILAGKNIPSNKCLVIETIYLGPFDNTKIEDISKEEFWEGKTTVKRIFPFSDERFEGFDINDPNAGQALKEVGKHGYWWVKDEGWNVYAHEDNAYTIKKPHGNTLSVRPFYYDIFNY